MHVFHIFQQPPINTDVCPTPKINTKNTESKKNIKQKKTILTLKKKNALRKRNFIPSFSLTPDTADATSMVSIKQRQKDKSLSLSILWLFQ